MMRGLIDAHRGCASAQLPSTRLVVAFQCAPGSRVIRNWRPVAVVVPRLPDWSDRRSPIATVALLPAHCSMFWRKPRLLPGIWTGRECQGWMGDTGVAVAPGLSTTEAPKSSDILNPPPVESPVGAEYESG